MANPKSELQEIFQKGGLALPDYKMLERSGPAHCLLFKVQVTVSLHGQELVEIAEGGSKKAAEKEAAKKLLPKVKEMLTPGGRRLSPAPSLPAMQTASYESSHAEVSTPSKTLSYEFSSMTSEPSGATAMDGSVVDGSTSPSSNSKNKLQEILQKKRWPIPEYLQVSRRLSSGNKPEFTVKCVVRIPSGEVAAEEYGHGSNKKEAEKDAATNMLPKLEKIFREGSRFSSQLPRSTELPRRGSASPLPETTDPDLDSDIQQYLSGYVPSYQTRRGEGLQESTKPWLCLATVNACCSFPVTAQGMGDTESAAKREAACNLLSNLNALGYSIGQDVWNVLHAPPDIAS